jgi:excinuclease UvrABC nuclease subunit
LPAWRRKLIRSPDDSHAKSDLCKIFQGRCAGDVLYVGKARSLKKRVTNYAQGRGHSNRITRMIAQTAAMEFVTTRTETEALLLEANLIKRLRPRFNVLLRDDKSLPLYPGGRRS